MTLGPGKPFKYATVHKHEALFPHLFKFNPWIGACCNFEGWKSGAPCNL